MSEQITSAMPQMPINPASSEKIMLATIVDGLSRLTDPELDELDTIITPRAAQLLSKAFGAGILELIGPLVVNDQMNDGTGNDVTGQVPATAANEGDLRRIIRDPRYWRDHDPDLVNRVQSGYQRLYS